MKGLNCDSICASSYDGVTSNNHQVDRMANPSFNTLTFTNESISFLTSIQCLLLYFLFNSSWTTEKEREPKSSVLEANLYEKEQIHRNFALLSSCLINKWMIVFEREQCSQKQKKIDFALFIEETLKICLIKCSTSLSISHFGLDANKRIKSLTLFISNIARMPKFTRKNKFH